MTKYRFTVYTTSGHEFTSAKIEITNQKFIDSILNEPHKLNQFNMLLSKGTMVSFPGEKIAAIEVKQY